jgi:hypothetical protein
LIQKPGAKAPGFFVLKPEQLQRPAFFDGQPEPAGQGQGGCFNRDFLLWLVII